MLGGDLADQTRDRELELILECCNAFVPGGNSSSLPEVLMRLFTYNPFICNVFRGMAGLDIHEIEYIPTDLKTQEGIEKAIKSLTPNRCTNFLICQMNDISYSLDGQEEEIVNKACELLVPQLEALISPEVDGAVIDRGGTLLISAQYQLGIEFHPSNEEAILNPDYSNYADLFLHMKCFSQLVQVEGENIDLDVEYVLKTLTEIFVLEGERMLEDNHFIHGINHQRLLEVWMARDIEHLLGGEEYEVEEGGEDGG